MYKLIPLFLLLAFSAFAASSTSIEASSDRPIVSATPTPEATGKIMGCDLSNFRVLATSQSRVMPGGKIAFEIISEKELSGSPIWTVSAGDIISGQGTNKIEVKAPASLPPVKMADPGEHGYLFQGVNAFAPYFTVAFMSADTCFNQITSRPIYFGNPILVNQFANVDELILDETSMVKPCEPGMMPLEGTKISPDMIIGVTAKASDPEKDILIYNYKVSGGTILGKGSEVLWDLSGVQPGTYKITAGVDDGCGICGRTVTKEINVFECTPVCGLVDCPIITINGPSTVSNSTVVNFKALVSSYSQTDGLTYSWTIENGEIIEGLNSPTITVRMPTNATNAVSSVKLYIGGIPTSWSCFQEFTKTYRNGKLVEEPR